MNHDGELRENKRKAWKFQELLNPCLSSAHAQTSFHSYTKSNEDTSGCDITPCIKIDKPLVVKISNVMQ